MPFDSPEYLLEVKRDGVRARAAVEAGRWRHRQSAAAGRASLGEQLGAMPDLLEKAEFCSELP